MAETAAVAAVSAGRPRFRDNLYHIINIFVKRHRQSYRATLIRFFFNFSVCPVCSNTRDKQKN